MRRLELEAGQERVVRFLGDADYRSQLEADVLAGLASTPKRLPPKYFYDSRGSELFELITRLPEYYPTRSETEILESVAEPIAALVQPEEVVELGSGSSRKTRLLLEAMFAAGSGHRYVALDVSEEALRAAGTALVRSYPGLEFRGYVGDFDVHLERLPRRGRRLVAFLGSTIGNLHPRERGPFLRNVAGLLRDGDRFLLGVDLVKDVPTLEAAYNDSAGVTADFNRNVLHVLNRALGADFQVERFEHRAWYDVENQWIEMALRASCEMSVSFPSLEWKVEFAEGELMQTEISCKFTRGSIDLAFEQAGLRLERWDLDSQGRFALALSCRA
jgi:L-histidine N-alpha-methyltransferase